MDLMILEVFSILYDSMILRQAKLDIFIKTYSHTYCFFKDLQCVQQQLSPYTLHFLVSVYSK